MMTEFSLTAEEYLLASRACAEVAVRFRDHAHSTCMPKDKREHFTEAAVESFALSFKLNRYSVMALNEELKAADG